jgi:sodium-coupled monocarboxylate transporter 8/12
MWFSAIGCLTVISVGMLVSILTGVQDPRKLNPKVISPGALFFLDLMPEVLRDRVNGYVGCDYVSQHRWVC